MNKKNKRKIKEKKTISRKRELDSIRMGNDLKKRRKKKEEM